MNFLFNLADVAIEPEDVLTVSTNDAMFFIFMIFAIIILAIGTMTFFIIRKVRKRNQK